MVETRGRLIKGMLITVAGAFLWGFSGNCIQFLQSAYQIDALFLATVRMLIGGFLFLVPVYFRHYDALMEVLHDGKALLHTAVFGIAGLMLCQLTYILAIEYTNAGTATVLQMFNVAIVLIVTCIIARRRPCGMEVLGVILALAATVLIATKGDLGTLNIPLGGLVWGLLSAINVTVYVMYPRRLFSRWGSVTITGLGMFIGGLAALVIDVVLQLAFNVSSGAVGQTFQVPALGIDGIVALVVVIVLGTCGSFGLFLYGVSIVGGVRGSLLGAVEPVCSTVISAVWLGTVFVWADWVGMVLMIGTTFVVSLIGDK